jgi:Mn2+/Fe2+ NRAMP family transporter
MRVRIQEKFAFPAICLVFGLIGSSLGVRPYNRTSRGQGFGISVLLIFGYYLMSFIFSSLGISGTLVPLLAAWSPVLIGLAAGLLPSPSIITDPGKLYIAIGILGATVMPHNLYLHSSIVQTRHLATLNILRGRSAHQG